LPEEIKPRKFMDLAGASASISLAILSRLITGRSGPSPEPVA